MKFLKIPVSIHPSGSFIIMFSFVVGFTADKSFPLYLKFISGLLFMTILFGSLLLHERSHIYMANKYGSRCTGIVIFMFGAVAYLETVIKNPKQKFLVWAAGPASSYLIAITTLLVLLLAKALLTNNLWGFTELYLLLSIQFNIVLGTFNLIPIYPSDGAQILHSILWKKYGSPQRAAQHTNIVSKWAIGIIWIGLYLGYLLRKILFFEMLWISLILIFVTQFQNHVFKQAEKEAES